MARFYGSIRGKAKSEATREGTASTGLAAHIRGWDCGVAVECNAVGDKDIISVFMTSGSNAATARRLLLTVTTGDDGNPVADLVTGDYLKSPDSLSV